MDVRQLIGKKFRYQSKYGLSDWEDTVKDIITQNNIEFDPPLNMSALMGDELFKARKCKVIGFSIKLFVVSEKSEQHYEFYDCIFKDEDNDRKN